MTLQLFTHQLTFHHNFFSIICQRVVSYEGGSIGSALAILTFYPLERIRVELQSQCANRRHNDKFDGNEGNDAGSGDDCSDIQSNNEGGKGKKGGRTNEGGKSEETRNTITSTCETDAIQNDSTENNSGITNSNPELAEESQISAVEQTILHREDASLTPHSSTGSFEVVSSPGAVDAESIEKNSSGESHEESVDGPDVAAGFVGRESDDPMILSAQSSRERLPTTGTNPDIGNINHREGMREKSSGQCKHVNVDATFSQKIASSSTKFPAEVDRLTKDASTSESIMQCLLRLYKEETLYKGASHMVTTLTISNFIFFYALQVAKRSLAPFEQLDNNQEHQLRHRLFKSNAYPILFCHLSKVMPKSKMGLSLLASSLAGAINVLLTNPLWVASLRIMESKVPSTSSLSNSSSTDKSRQCNQQQNLWKVICHIARTEGILHLWNGMLVSLLLVSNPAIQHFLYGQLRTWLLEKRNDQINRRRRGRHGSGFPSITTLTPVEAFLFGALAKTGATVCTYPLQ